MPQAHSIVLSAIEKSYHAEKVAHVRAETPEQETELLRVLCLAADESETKLTHVDFWCVGDDDTDAWRVRLDRIDATLKG